MILEFEARGQSFVRFNTEDYPVEVKLVWCNSEGAALRLKGVDHPLNQFRSIWYRRPVYPRLGGADAGLSAWAAEEAHHALQAVWRTQLPALWVNHPDSNTRAEWKPLQLQLAAACGLLTVPTVVTNDPTEAARFASAQSEGVVCKPLRSGRVRAGGVDQLFFTSLVEVPSEADVPDLGPEPYLFQRFVPKRYDVRVTGIGSDLYAARIESQLYADTRVDWRRGRPSDLPHTEETLPEEISAACRKLMVTYGLSFAAIDLVRARDGRYIFMEVNPNGQWAWIDQQTRLPLRARLADLLVHGQPTA